MFFSDTLPYKYDGSMMLVIFCQNVCHNLAAEVDGVVEVAAMDSLQTYKALSFNKSLTSDPRQCVVEIKVSDTFYGIFFKMDGFICFSYCNLCLYKLGPSQ